MIGGVNIFLKRKKSPGIVNVLLKKKILMN